jgi:Ca-activated chloride channel family protein
VRLTYEHLLAGEGGRIDYVLPRSESLKRHAPWDITVDIQSAEPISTVYSPSHELITQRTSDRQVQVRLSEPARTQPGPFLLSYLIESDGVSASLFAYPDPQVGGGYFLLMAGLPASIADADRTVKREVTLVIDRSGSMAGEKMDQVRAAALQVIEGLADGEAFNIIDYSTTVSAFSARPVIKNRHTTLEARRYLALIRPTGGTNIHDGLLEALRQEPADGMLPIVLFLTDGLPTVGRTSEVAIRDMVSAANTHKRRIFTFGVGGDVNAPLLDRIADTSRGKTTYVLPGEDVELKVAQVFKRLSGPVLSDVQLSAHDPLHRHAMVPIGSLMPMLMPDLFEDDQLIVLGQYRYSGPITFRLTGDYFGRKRTFEFRFDTSGATTRNAFVPRLWATRQIAFLIDQIRQAGADTSAGATPLDDPRYRELTEEILRLSAEFGVLTEYTAFLATEGTDLSDWSANWRTMNVQLDRRAIGTRAGQAAVNQSMNWNFAKGQAQLNMGNAYFDEHLNRVEIATVQQVNDRAFFRQGNRWVDGRLVAKGEEAAPDIVIEFGSAAHQALLRQLISENRQGVLSLPGDIVIRLEGRNILVRNTGR